MALLEPASHKVSVSVTSTIKTRGKTVGAAEWQTTTDHHESIGGEYSNVYQNGLPLCMNHPASGNRTSLTYDHQ